MASCCGLELRACYFLFRALSSGSHPARQGQGDLGQEPARHPGDALSVHVADQRPMVSPSWPGHLVLTCPLCGFLFCWPSVSWPFSRPGRLAPPPTPLLPGPVDQPHTLLPAPWALPQSRQPVSVPTWVPFLPWPGHPLPLLGPCPGLLAQLFLHMEGPGLLELVSCPSPGHPPLRSPSLAWLRAALGHNSLPFEALGSGCSSCPQNVDPGWLFLFQCPIPPLQA